MSGGSERCGMPGVRFGVGGNSWVQRGAHGCHSALLGCVPGRSSSGFLKEDDDGGSAEVGFRPEQVCSRVLFGRYSDLGHGPHVSRRDDPDLF